MSVKGMKDIINKQSFTVKFNLENGLSPEKDSKKRMLSDMKNMYLDDEAYNNLLKKQDIVVYEFYDLGIKEKPEELAYGTTILYPGKVGDEYFMTKGHFHEIIETAEVYYCMKGKGYMLMENPEGNVELQEFKPGISVYVPPRFAHRSINISHDTPLIAFFAFRADAGHDYKTIESKGFRKIILEKNGKPELIDNPKWTSKK